jgi:hypothetical protein
MCTAWVSGMLLTVKMYKAYKGKRPTDYNQEDKPFYLAPVTNKFKPNDNEQWFLRAPVGRNKHIHYYDAYFNKLIENGNNDNIFFSLAFLLEIKMRLF